MSCILVKWHNWPVFRSDTGADSRPKQSYGIAPLQHGCANQNAFWRRGHDVGGLHEGLRGSLGDEGHDHSCELRRVRHRSAILRCATAWDFIYNDKELGSR